MKYCKDDTEKRVGVVYVTKYALSRGIMKYPWGLVDMRSALNAVRVPHPGGLNAMASYYRTEWHLDLASAVRKVVQMIEAKRKSLRGQLAALDALATNMAEDTTPVEDMPDPEATTDE